METVLHSIYKHEREIVEKGKKGIKKKKKTYSLGKVLNISLNRGILGVRNLNGLVELLSLVHNSRGGDDLTPSIKVGGSDLLGATLNETLNFGGQETKLVVLVLALLGGKFSKDSLPV